MEIKNIFLKNGLQVILKKEEFSKVSVVNILYKVGSKNDPESKKGLTHLFEHLLKIDIIILQQFQKRIEGLLSFLQQHL